ncbi:MAG: DUF1501 domain-containing protein [Verrucomicrobia bacterium]|nr:DUF1501 domain-containing protein [Verrucomicrobiota bacterium]
MNPADQRRSPPLRLASVESRREFVSRLGAGLGGVALWQLLDRDLAVAGEIPSSLPHHAPKARRVIQLFMNGGASQMDLFDYKPELLQRAGQTFDPGAGVRVEAATSEPGKVLPPQFPFRRHGQCGRWVSDLLPHLGACVDDMAFFMAMASRTNVHGPGSYLMNTGFLLPGFPCFGSWISYGLGRIADNLPTFVVLPDAKGLPYNQKGNFSSGFLPAQHQGTVIQASAPNPIADLAPPEQARFITPSASQEGLTLLDKFNRAHQAMRAEDTRLESRVRAYELAARMQLSAPEVFDLSGEPAELRRAYGLEEPASQDFGRRCLLARRMIERGVRFVQVWSGAGGPSNNWDNHTSIAKELPPMCAATDLPIATLLRDLKARGLLEDTLVLWNTEFGRMPFSQGGEGRDHNGGAFVGWMAGAGVRGGAAYGETDPWSWKAQSDVTSTYDFHATVLHLLGIQHEKLSVRFSGANRRLTDVHGRVVTQLLA